MMSLPHEWNPWIWTATQSSLGFSRLKPWLMGFEGTSDGQVLWGAVPGMRGSWVGRQSQWGEGNILFPQPIWGA